MPGSTSGNPAIPPAEKCGARVLLQLGAQTLIDSQAITGLDFTLPTIALERLTINPNVSNNVAHPQLYVNGQLICTSSVTVPNASTTNLSLTLFITSPDVSKTYSKTLSPEADRYIAIGLDANQFSDQLLVSKRTIVNGQEFVQANGQTVNTDAEIGGLLDLALATYFNDADEGENSIAGLTGAVADDTWVACGIATSDGTTGTAPRDPGLQFPYLPKSMGLDVPGNLWGGIPIDSTDTTHDVTRHLLMGYENSSLEGLVWEELTNYDSISTVKAFQLAEQDPTNSLVTITPSNVGSIQTLLPHLASQIWTDITTYVNDSTNHYSVLVPTEMITIGSNNPQGPWTGVGYTITPTTGANAGYTMGYIIDGEVNGQWESPHGGGSYGNLVTPDIVFPTLNPVPSVDYFGNQIQNTVMPRLAQSATQSASPMAT